jgi:hypothetical protein
VARWGSPDHSLKGEVQWRSGPAPDGKRSPPDAGLLMLKCCVFANHAGTGSNRARAEFRYSINRSSLKGLLKKPIAPAFNARARVLSSERADMKIIGVRLP